jgi:hypothetical protein
MKYIGNVSRLHSSSVLGHLNMYLVDMKDIS